MNILYLSRTMGQGGAEKIVYQLATETALKGANVFVASCGGVYVKQLEKHGIPHIQLDDLECKKPQVIFKTLRILTGVLRRERIDIIHTHHRMAQFYAILLKLRFPRIQIVYTAHNVFFDKILFTRMVLQKSVIVSVGDGVKENLIQKFCVSPDQIKVIYNGVQDEKSEVDCFNSILSDMMNQNHILIGAIGRLSEQKGMDVFIRVIKNLLNQGFPVKGIIIGDGEDKNILEKMIRDMNLQKDILLMGYQNHIPALVRQLDFVIMPSRWEGFPLLPFEVFYANRTMIASKISGIKEMVKRMENGILVEPDDEKAFTEAAVCLITDETLRKNLERNGKDTFEKYNHYGDFVNQYNQIYKKITGE